MRRGSQSRGSAHAGQYRWGWLRGLSTLGACLAIFLNAFVVQTHVEGLSHVLAGVERVAGGADVDSSATPPYVLAERGDQKAGCLICQALAGAGRAVLASAPQLDETYNLAASEATVRIRYIRVAPSHAWRSRAPPTLL
jgi:hypothetical protein